MPIIKKSGYTKRPWYCFNAWMETLIPYYTRKKYASPYQRERLELSDGDFLDLDWVKNGSDQLVIVSHGFEGNSRDHFIMELAVNFKEADLLVWHYRSCGGELNRLPRFYSQADIGDLDEVIMHASKNSTYKQVILAGFSMGGNLVINYIGSDLYRKEVSGGVVFSTPMDLKAASEILSSSLFGRVERSFIEKLRRKIEKKASVFSAEFEIEKLGEIRNFEELMETFFLPKTGFSNAQDFYQQWSSWQFISQVRVPLLIVNAKNDPLLSENCYPYELCAKSEHVYLETPKYGGHTGFTGRKDGQLWYVYRIREFIANITL